MTPVQLDWSTAQVADGGLTVELSARPSPAWRTRAKSALGLLGRSSHGWRTIAIKKDRVVVGEIAEGSEDDLRHFLESIVQQANAGEIDDSAPPPDDADTRMTAAFQAFAEPAESR